VLSTEFWIKVEDCLRASGPLLIVLRVVDGDEKPAMPEVATLMNHAKEKIRLSFAIQSKKTLLKKVKKTLSEAHGSSFVSGCNVFEPRKIPSS
jgi:hypothetical protein